MGVVAVEVQWRPAYQTPIYRTVTPTAKPTGGRTTSGGAASADGGLPSHSNGAGVSAADPTTEQAPKRVIIGYTKYPCRVLGISSATFAPWPFNDSSKRVTLRTSFDAAARMTNVQTKKIDAGPNGIISGLQIVGEQKVGDDDSLVAMNHASSKVIDCGFLTAYIRSPALAAHPGDDMVTVGSSAGCTAGSLSTSFIANAGEFITALSQATSSYGQVLSITASIGNDKEYQTLKAGWQSGASTAPFVNCCTGNPDESVWCTPAGVSASNKSACDAPMKAYCSTSKGKSTNACACISSPVSTSACLDRRCAENASAYRIAGQPAYGERSVAQQSGCVNSIVTCAQANVLGKNLVAGYAVPQCDSSKTRQTIIIGIIILAILLALIAGGGKKRSIEPSLGDPFAADLPDLDSLTV